jgi:hypothetical protein
MEVDNMEECDMCGGESTDLKETLSKKVCIFCRGSTGILGCSDVAEINRHTNQMMNVLFNELYNTFIPRFPR